MTMEASSSSSSSSSTKSPALIECRRSKRKSSTKVFKSWPSIALKQVRIPLTKRELDGDSAGRPLPKLQERKTDKLFPGSTLPRVITLKRYINTG